MHQNHLLRDIFFFTSTMWLNFCISDGDIKIPLVPTMALSFKAVKNMEDKQHFNLDKFHLCARLLLSCPKYLTTHHLAWTKFLSIKLSASHIFYISATVSSLS